MKLTLGYVRDKTGGNLLSGDPGQMIKGAAIDSRLLTEGNIFFALPGQRVDGHNFLEEAFLKGAAAAVISKDVEVSGRALLKVADAERALQDLAKAYRREFSIPVIAVTGSVGKTTTKEILSWCLEAAIPNLKNKGNYNNELGVPLTLLQLEESHQAAVLEMAMRRTGEISRLCETALPTHAIITNIAGVHLETMGTLENIARAKCEVLGNIPGEGFALMNGDNDLLRKTAECFDVDKYYFGYGDNCHIRIMDCRLSDSGMWLETRIFDYTDVFFFPLPVMGWAGNIAAAAGMAQMLGVPAPLIKERLKNFDTLPNRLNVITLSAGGRIINDAYNANPLSVISALEVGNIFKGQSDYVAVLGDMLELGSERIAGHRQVGRAAFEKKVDRLVLIGTLAEEVKTGAIQAGMSMDKIKLFSNREDGLDYLRRILTGRETILFKASRALQFEKIIDEVVKDFI
ncbi:MAG: UDP-N-acetylmuramoyl-tripeptide--D-alanyl-D-alanine ligase [Syntrophomonadaceae bacterium]|jgi:UDP-N-acetylmuramoyl-tripeptide--D-alanyl-D-alanine ligase|nr:UDP-N-acetylmuramoyl-tripeptide--D-alanyl-D-alanine ligase [Syntrophomonadaceae bacterium]